MGRKKQHAALGAGFQRLWAGTAAANLADGAVLALLPLMALSITDAPGEVAAVTVAATAAWAVFGLPGGWLVDVVDRRRLLVLVNAARSLILLGLMTAALTHVVTVALLVVVALMLGLGEVLADSSFTALVPEVVPPHLRGRANARVETTVNVLNQLAGPPLAGLLLGLSAVAATGATALLYAAVLPALLLLGRRKPSAASDSDEHTKSSFPWPGWTEITVGLRSLWRDALLRWLTVLTAAMNLVWATWGALFVLYAVAPGALGLDPAGYGLLLTAMAVGGIVVAPLIDPAVRRFGVRPVLLADLVGTVFLVGPTAAGLGLAPVAVGLLLAGAGATVWRTVVATLRQNLVPQTSLGRVYSASRLISWGVIPLGATAAGVLAQTTSVATTFAAATCVALVVLIGSLLVFRHTDLDTPYAGTSPQGPVLSVSTTAPTASR